MNSTRKELVIQRSISTGFDGFTNVKELVRLTTSGRGACSVLEEIGIHLILKFSLSAVSKAQDDCKFTISLPVLRAKPEVTRTIAQKTE